MMSSRSLIRCGIASCVVGDDGSTAALFQFAALPFLLPFDLPVAVLLQVVVLLHAPLDGEVEAQVLAAETSE